MKLIRYRKPSLKTALGITKVKRSIAKATGIPTTKSGRKRKALNAVTGGAYGQYQRTRAAINRPIKHLRNPPTLMGIKTSKPAARRAKQSSSCLGCMVSIFTLLLALNAFTIVIFQLHRQSCRVEWSFGLLFSDGVLRGEVLMKIFFVGEIAKRLD